MCLPGAEWRVEHLRWLLSSGELSELGRETRDSIIGEASLKQILAIFVEDAALARQVLARNPRLLEKPAAWSQGREFQQACLEVAVAVSDADRVASAIVRAEGFGLFEEFFRAFGSGCIPIVLSEVNRALNAGVPCAVERWCVLAQRSPSSVTQWLAELGQPLDGRMLRVLASFVPFSALQGVAGHPIASALLSGDVTVSHYRDWGSAGIALAVAFGLEGEEGALIASQCFEAVHAALMCDGLPWFAWNAIEPFLPPGGMWGLFYWDNAEKVRRAYAETFANRRWPVGLFRDGLRNPDTRHRVEAYCRGSSTAWILLH
jgi:hypothetical protein